MSIIEKINSEYPQMTKSEKALSAYLLAHLDEFETLSIQELADRNNVSTTTLIRFTRKLGYDGYKEFKRAVCSSSVVHPNLISKFEHIAFLSNNKILSDTINHGFTCIEDTFSRLSAEKIDRTISLLTKSRRVYTFGMKESYALAHYAYTRLYTVRDNTLLLNISNGDVEALLDVQKDDVCLAFLFHRYTKRSLEVLSLLQKIGVPVILVTNDPYDSVEKYAEVVLPCTVYGVGIKNTSIAPICLLDYFCNVIATNNSKKSLDRMKSIEELLKDQSALGS